MSMSRSPTEMAMRLRTLLGDHPCTAGLKSGSITSDLVAFDFVDYSPTNKGFKPMVRELAFDVSEMAIVTYLMAQSFGKPMVLLPDVVVARFQHAYALYNAKHGALKPADLNGKLDAVLGEKSEHPELRPLFADASGEENAWFARHGVLPINHMVVVSQELSESHPEAVREVHRLLGEANKASASSPRYSREEMRRSLELIISYTAQQGLIPHPFTFDELFDDVTQALL